VAEAALEAGLGFALILDEVQNLSAADYEGPVMALRPAKQKEGVPSEQTVVVPRPSSKSVVRVWRDALDRRIAPTYFPERDATMSNWVLASRGAHMSRAGRPTPHTLAGGDSA
jgi:hypothetical protein